MSLARHAWVLAAALAACAKPAHWEKPGASASAVQEDSEQCRVKARLESQLLEPLPSLTPRVLTVEEQRQLDEIQHFQKCMQDKGYAAKR
jgi:hypothetical protein